MRPPNSSLTDHELEFMQIVWDRDEVTVRDVYEELLRRRKIAYTTVMTTMKTLEHKGYLETSQRDRAYVYRPTRPKAQVVKKMVRDFVDRVFHGSAQPLVAHLLEERQLSESDLAEITRLIAKDGPKSKDPQKEKATTRKKQ
jgi:BlaI family penicillinase repressor